MPNRPFKLATKDRAPPRRFTLDNEMPLGRFTGMRRLEVIPQGAGCRFEREEVSRGLLAPVMARVILDRQPAFDTFAADLEARAERG